MRAALGLLILLLLPHTALPAQGLITSWTPARPLEGGLLRIAAAASAAPHDTVPPIASLAGEPLHFERDSSGGWAALAAVPLAGADSVVLWVRRPGNDDSVWVRIPVAPRSAGVERLRTDPRFVEPLDSALAERVRRETERVAAALRGSHQRPRLWSEAFRRPRPSRVTSLFGRGRTFNGESRGRHRGTDFSGVRGAAVQAANRGVVVLADELYYAGRAVYVDHGAGVVTAYMHLDRATVSVGDTVAHGQLIGRVGASGRVTGPHLHWSAYFGRVSFDPLDLLTLDPLPPP